MCQDGKARDPALGEYVRWSDSDTFDFKFFALPSKHVQIINSIFLENAPSTQAIVYKTCSALYQALKHYLQLEMPGIKVLLNSDTYADGLQDCAVPNKHDYGRYIPGLEKLVNSLGSRVRAKYNEPRLVMVMPTLPKKFEERYKALGK
jgi:hypothetical protein